MMNIEDTEITKIEDEEELNAQEVHETQEVTDLKNQVALLEDQLRRSLAESENMRRRMEKMIDEARQYSIVNFAKDLLVVIDNLSRALEYKVSDNQDQIESVLTGVDLTKTELESVMKRYGVESILPVSGDKFDYNLHHAISQVVTDEYPTGSIVSIMQPGYKIQERLLRPAIVTVAKESL